LPNQIHGHRCSIMEPSSVHSNLPIQQDDEWGISFSLQFYFFESESIKNWRKEGSLCFFFLFVFEIITGLNCSLIDSLMDIYYLAYWSFWVLLIYCIWVELVWITIPNIFQLDHFICFCSCFLSYLSTIIFIFWSNCLMHLYFM
jgi:hypothetical protein